jgi:thioredoxin reductase (NADPH)
MENVIIVGTGCAGLTAAIYTARANLAPLVLEGRQPGGQLTTTTAVENFPGFPDGVDGPELIMRMHAQAEKFGARFRYGTVEEFEHADGVNRIKVDGDWLETRALIVASGASPRYLGIDGEKELIGHGLTSCATCDGAFYRNVPVCVVGGGDSACEGRRSSRASRARSISSTAATACARRRSWPTGRWKIPRSSRSGTAP